MKHIASPIIHDNFQEINHFLKNTRLFNDIDVDVASAEFHAFVVGVIETVDDRGTVLQSAAGVDRGTVAVDKAAVDGFDIEFGAVGDQFGVDRHAAKMSRVAGCRQCACRSGVGCTGAGKHEKMACSYISYFRNIDL